VFGRRQSEGPNRITLDLQGDGQPDSNSVLDHLTRRLASRWWAHGSLRRQHGCHRPLSVRRWRDQYHCAGHKLTDLPGGLSIITGRGCWPVRRLQTVSRCRIEQQHRRKRNWAEYERAAIWELIGIGAHRIFASGNRNPNWAAVEPETGKLWAIANEPTRSGLTRSGLSDLGADGGFLMAGPIAITAAP